MRELRDPLATDPALLLATSGIPAKKVATHWEPYLSLDPHFDQVRQVGAERLALQKQVIRFGLDSAELPLDQFAALNSVEDELNTLRCAAGATGCTLRIEVSGHQSLDRENLIGTEAYPQELDRRVIFRVITDRTGR